MLAEIVCCLSPMVELEVNHTAQEGDLHVQREYSYFKCC